MRGNGTHYRVNRVVLNIVPLVDILKAGSADPAEASQLLSVRHRHVREHFRHLMTRQRHEKETLPAPPERIQGACSTRKVALVAEGRKVGSEADWRRWTASPSSAITARLRLSEMVAAAVAAHAVACPAGYPLAVVCMTGSWPAGG
jgi:hypothetical protein